MIIVIVIKTVVVLATVVCFFFNLIAHTYLLLNVALFVCMKISKVFHKIYKSIKLKKKVEFIPVISLLLKLKKKMLHNFQRYSDRRLFSKKKKKKKTCMVLN